MTKFKLADAGLKPGKIKWNDDFNRLCVLHQLKDAVGLPSAWKLEQQIFLYALGLDSSRTAYVHKTVQILYMLDHFKEKIDALPDITVLPWMEEHDVYSGSATAACWEQRREKWNTQHKLQSLQLEVPQGLQGCMRCRKCGSHNLNVEMRQTRSADEGMTAFITCTKCGHKW